MKLTLSYLKASEIIADRHNLSGYQVEIEPKPIIEGSQTKPIFPLHQLILLVRGYRYRGDEKIAAIKAVREYGNRYGVSIGLADAKNFVESL